MNRPRLRREGDRVPHVVTTLVAVALLVVAALALVLRQVATPWQPTIAVTTFSHYLMLTAPVALAGAVLVRRGIVSAMAAVLTMLVLVIQVPPIFASGAPSPGTPLVVMQANLKLGGGDPRAVVRLVREHHVQLLATEELTPEEQDGLVAAGLSTLLPHRFAAPAPNGGGIGMWSVFPLTDRRKVPGFRLGVLSAHLTVPGRLVTFLAAHILPPYPFPAPTWRRELPALRDVLADEPPGRAVLVAGDFNATVDHAQFRDLLEHGYADAADQAGAGYPPTYPNDAWYGPLIAIDHVLTRGGVATSLHTYEVARSDHRAVIAQVVVAHAGA